MKKSTSLQTISCYVTPRATRVPGKCSINLGISIDGKHDRIPLGIFWPTELFDKEKERLIPKPIDIELKDDVECKQNNLIIDKNIAVANQLRLQLYAFPERVTTQDFKRMFRAYSSREKVLDYLLMKINANFDDGLISEQTWKNNLAVYRKLLEYDKSQDWTFGSVRASDLQLYYNWSMTFGKIVINRHGTKIRKPLKYNTVVGHFKVLAKYFEQAKKDKIPFDDPFDDYKIGRYVPGDREVISLEELRDLYAYRKNNELTEVQKRRLDKYLLGCFTGLRKSDIEKLEPKKLITTGVLHLSPNKTIRYGTEIKFKLPSQAIEILKDYQEGGFEFDNSASLGNAIKLVAARRGINKLLKFHSSRDFFGVQYVKMGGNVADLKDIMGHKRISTTEIYLKMGSDAKDDIMSRFENLLK